MVDIYTKEGKLNKENYEEKQKKDDGYDEFFDNYGPDSEFCLRVKKSLSVVLPKKEASEEKVELVRCNSHTTFQYHPDFVPRPKPKKTEVVVSPMKLCRKKCCENANTNIINDYLANTVDCNSCPDSEDEQFLFDDEDSLSEETQPFSPVEETSLNIVRKEMVKTRTTQNPEKLSNEYENILKIDDFINESNNYYNNKRKRKSMFKKHIVKQEEDNFIRMSGGIDLLQSKSARLSDVSKTISRNTVGQQGRNFSLLGILESAANEVNNSKSLRESFN